MIIEKKACCFTGHRKISSAPDVKTALKKVILEKMDEGYYDFLSGMAVGFDLLAAQIVLELKKEYPLLRLFCILPCADQSKKYMHSDLKVYQSVLDQADAIYILQDDYSRGCMHKRNRFLVDHSECVISFLTRNYGGTAYTVNYASKKGKNIINIPSYIDGRKLKCPNIHQM